MVVLTGGEGGQNRPSRSISQFLARNFFLMKFQPKSYLIICVALEKGFQNIYGLGGGREPLTEVTGPASGAGPGFLADFGADFRLILGSEGPVRPPKPVFGE